MKPQPADTKWRPRWWSPDPERKEYFCEVGPETFIHVWRYDFWPWREWAWNVHHLMPGHDFGGHQHYSTQTGNAKGKKRAIKAAKMAIDLREECRGDG